MSMAVVLIFFLILLLHPYDEQLSRTLSSYGPLGRVRHLTDIGLSQWYLIPAFAIGVCLIGIDWSNIARHRRIRFGLVYAQATFAFWAIALVGDSDEHCEVPHRPGPAEVYRYAGGDQFFAL